MILKKIALFCLLLSGTAAFGQRTEIGIWAGGSGYLGDLNYNNPLKLTDPAGGFLFKVNYNPFLALRLGVSQAKIQGADSLAANKEQQSRNLSFKSNLTEICGAIEFNFFKYGVKTSHKFSPFTFVGLSAFLFNPQAEYQGQTYDLQSLGTEGQRLNGKNKAYSLVNLAVPFGAGFKWNIGGKTTLGAEMGYRYTFTDYLDDVSGAYADQQALQNGSNGTVTAALADRSGEKNNGTDRGRSGSQRGDMRKNDSYFFAGLSLTYTFVPRKCPSFD